MHAWLVPAHVEDFVLFFYFILRSGIRQVYDMSLIPFISQVVNIIWKGGVYLIRGFDRKAPFRSRHDHLSISFPTFHVSSLLLEMVTFSPEAGFHGGTEVT